MNFIFRIVDECYFQRTIRVSDQLVIFTIAWLYLMATGCPWRSLPFLFGKWNTIYYFWKRNRSRILQFLAPRYYLPILAIDSTYMRPNLSCERNIEKDSVGMARFGRVSKTTVVCDILGRIVSISLAPGNKGDIKEAYEMIPDLPTERIAAYNFSNRYSYKNAKYGMIIGDAAYYSQQFAIECNKKGYQLCSRPNRRSRHEANSPLLYATDPKSPLYSVGVSHRKPGTYRMRNVIELLFRQLKLWSRIVHRRDGTNTYVENIQLLNTFVNLASHKHIIASLGFGNALRHIMDEADI